MILLRRFGRISMTTVILISKGTNSPEMDRGTSGQRLLSFINVSCTSFLNYNG